MFRNPESIFTSCSSWRPLGALCVFLLTVALSLPGCENTSEPPLVIPDPAIGLSLVDVGVVEAWLRISLDSTVQSRQFELHRGGEVALISQLIGRDTVIADAGLLPNTPYTYLMYIVDDSSVVDSSLHLSLTTMDTTVNGFSFVLDSLGAGSLGDLSGVAILDENNIWAVGSLTAYDSTGTRRYSNVVHWDGGHWAYMNISSQPARAICAIGPNDIWVATTNLHHFNGVSWQVYDGAGTVYVQKIWASSASNVYAVGLSGSVAHFDGSTWRRLASGTAWDVFDVFGATNPSTGQTEVYAVASYADQFVDNVILRIDGTTVTHVSDLGLSEIVRSLWFKSQRRSYVVGSGIFSKMDMIENDPWEILSPGVTQSFYAHGIFGTDLNDIYVYGRDYSDGTIEFLHFNGVSWRSYRSEIQLSSGYLSALSIKGDLTVGVGAESDRYGYTQPRVLIGTR